MAKIKLSKNELKKQKDELKRYQRYLPTLVLKKQQLQMELRKIESALLKKQDDYNGINDALMKWIAVFGEKIDLNPYLEISYVKKGFTNIAGIDIPVFEGIGFKAIPWDLFLLPLWVDRAVEVLKELAALHAEIEVLEIQKNMLREELRVTSQRINLFEKVKIPEARENIRVIRIYLGDQQIAAVVRGKISKNKIVRSQSA